MTQSQIRTDLKVEKLELAKLELAAYNPREMTQEARQGLHESLDDLGLLELPVVNAKHDPPRVIGGHQRIRDLTADGYTHADCVVVRFDDTAEMAANVALNSPALQGVFDPVRQVPGLQKIAARLPKPNHTRFEDLTEKIREQARRAQAASNKRAEDTTPTKRKKADSTVGQVYYLGEHRLYCGDFHDGVSVVLGRKKADVTITDPPYNLAYTSGKWFRNDKLREEISGDDMDPDEWRQFVTDYCDAIVKATKGAIYMFTAAQEMHVVEQCFADANGALHRWIVAAKNAHPLSPGDYHPQYEMILYGGRHNADVAYYGKAKPNVLPMQRPSKNVLHPTQKPVAAIRELVEDSTDVGHVILDLFAGSGTTICVAEELERICYACEIDPVHCDTIRQRWAEQAHGKDADWKTLTLEPS